MIDEKNFEIIMEKAKTFKYTAMNYIDFDDCKNAEILHDSNDLILLYDRSKSPIMTHWAADNFEAVAKAVTLLPGKLRIHFVPDEFRERLKSLGFIEWVEYADIFNTNLADTAAKFGDVGEIEYLTLEDCEKVSTVSKECMLQSRGFEGESAEWLAGWILENKVIICRKNSDIVGFCCVSIYAEGTILWIRELAVAPLYQGLGYGKKLMEQAIYYGVQKGAKKGFLAADILNKNALSLYEKYNFYPNLAERELQMVRE
ncbi:MAG: GNAT family N-acetyltransferase [Defluviitaleaceae bacterium]|nr:GNAT family N-acetyltransferase [Defluviitaleaceae bacterium]